MSPISFLLVLGLVFWNIPKYDTAINNNVIRVCTAGYKDHENCIANKKIADGEGINPSIECVQLKSGDRDTYECIDEVLAGETTRADALSSVVTSSTPPKAERQCNSNTTVNLYAGREGALKCLSDTGAGHFAAITVDDNSILPNGMKVMCKNGTLSDTLDIDEACYLTEMPSEAIAIRADNPRLAAIQETLGRVMNASRTVRGEFIQIPKGGFENNERQGKFMKFFNSIDKCPYKPREISQGRSGQIAIIVVVVVIVVVIVVTIVIVLGYFGYRHYKKDATSKNTRRQNTDLTGPEGPTVPELINPEEVPLTILNQNHNADKN